MHRFPVRVYYEDTDFSGVVYHASYLRFLERGRTEFLRMAGISHRSLHGADPPLALAVKRMEIEFERAARMDDELWVETRLSSLKGASLLLDQSILRGAERLIEARVVIVCIAGERPVRLPSALRSAMSAWLTRETPIPVHNLQG
jgi:acyl-CoA thioester hydrolase